ncbi:2-oxoacid:acceptor oxidoreductase family protein [Aestuariibacter salexigens]|uniref:2-oxoacid:acceptor oxidoreductase family protein n=1 Tax=Aestuariibacter salexigens TaxID=226010 RepID=UPI000411AD01|nr:2-oxoacid:acceptor oxidoreductase family protein [Aestuariibacter salexigens]
MSAEHGNFPYPGKRAAMDGNSAVIMCERESSDAAGAYPITPSTQMGELWAKNAAQGHLNMSGRPLIFIEPEGEHAAAAVTAGLAMTGLRSANFSSGQGIAYMHESLYAAVGKRLTYVLNIGARAMTKATLNVHAGHDDYHCVDDTGFFQLFAANAQQAADLNIIAHRIAEMSLTPGIVAQDGFLTTHLIESLLLPEPELIAEFLGRPDDIIDTPTAAQRMIFGDKRRRIPLLWDVDNPVMSGVVQNQDAYMQSVAAQRPYFFAHVKSIADEAMDQFYRLTGRQYARIAGYRMDDAEYVILGQGSVIPSAQRVVNYLRETRGIKVGVVNMLMFRPFPADLLTHMLKGKKAVTVMERLDQPLAVELPLLREIRSAAGQALENGRHPKHLPYPDLASYSSLSDLPEFFSVSFGLGSRDLQPEGIIAAVENMLPDGAHRKHAYVSIDFLHDQPRTPKQEIFQQELVDSYPNVGELALKGSENPNLMPDGSITVRFHSIGGWGAITTGKNLAMTLFELLGYHIKANPKYGSEKKGQPTTYFLSAAPEPIRINCEYYFVDVVLSPDPNVLQHTNALAGLKSGGIFVIQSELGKPDKVWQSIPEHYQQYIVDNDIRVFFIDAFKIAREEATDSDLQLRMQGNAFQGAFFAASSVMRDAGLDEHRLLDAIRRQLQHKFGEKGARIVEENIRVVQRGFDEICEITRKDVGVQTVEIQPVKAASAQPIMLKRLPQSHAAATDIHRFWEQTGSFYAKGQGSDNLADPFMSLGTIPASSATFRDMTGIRFEHPEWIAENCTACGKCYTVCPDTAIPGLVNDVSQVLDTLVARIKKQGTDVQYLPRAVRQLEPILHSLFDEAGESARVAPLVSEGIKQTIANYRDSNGNPLNEDDNARLETEMAALKSELNGFKFAITTPFYRLPEKQQKGSGGLFSVTVNPYTCKGCKECVQVCEDDALRTVRQTPQSISELKTNWDLWLDLPSTPAKYQRIDDLQQGVGALTQLLLDKQAYSSTTSGDGACLGCSEKTAIHLFTATVEALMRPRVSKHLAYLDDLIGRLKQHIRDRLMQSVDLDDTDAIDRVLHAPHQHDLSLAELAQGVSRGSNAEPIDPDWLERVNHLLAKLKHLRWCYTDADSARGRSAMGMVNATGCSSVWGSTFPFNPYPFPWANHLFQDATSMAMGVFEGHMVKMADGFKAIRSAELEIKGAYRRAEHDDYFARFNWRDFTDEEFLLCPPVVAVGGDGAMYDIGFQNLSRAMMSGKPLKIIVLDTQVYSNTGGQACTSGFMGQVSDMAEFGQAIKGKQEARKEMGLIAMAHRTTYVLQSTIAHANHMLEGFIEGLQSRRAALFNIYTACQPEHGIGDDMGHHQAKLAVESRAYPIFKYNPDRGHNPADCFEMDGNPAMDEVWPTYALHYVDDGLDKSMSLPMTFADFAMTENRFRKHFRTAPVDTWHDNMMLLADYIELPKDEREGRYPFIWMLDKQQQLGRLLVDDTMVASCEERRDFWLMLNAIAGTTKQDSPALSSEQQIRQQVVAQIASGLMKLAAQSEPVDTSSLDISEKVDAPAPQPASTSMAPWIDSDSCTACDECIKLNAKIFAYNDDKQAYIKDPQGGPYRDLVKAAEKCTAQVIHPGLPIDASEKDIDKWVARGEKYN